MKLEAYILMPLVFPNFSENGLEVHVVGSVKFTCQTGIA